MTWDALGEWHGPAAALATATGPGGATATIALNPPADDLARLSPTVDLHDVELAIEGTWDASTGRVPLTRQTFESVLAAAADPQVDAAAVHFGHFDPRFPTLSDGEPAVGWVRPTRIDQRDGLSVLVGDITNVPTTLVQVIKNAYRRRSVELAADLTTPAGRRYPAVLTGLGLLGRTAPAVKGLKDIVARYLSAPTAPAGGALHTVYLDGMPGDTPPPGCALPGALLAAGHDGRGTSPRPEEAARVPRVTDERLRQLLGLAADQDVTVLQSQLAVMPDPAAAPPAAPAAPTPPPGYAPPPGYVLQPIAPVAGQPAAPAAPAAQPIPPTAPAGYPALVPQLGQPGYPAGYQVPGQQPLPPTGYVTVPGQQPPAPAPTTAAPAAYPPGVLPLPGQPQAAQPVVPGQPSPAAPPVGQPAIAAGAGPGVVALSADQWAAVSGQLALGEKDRRDRTAYAAFAAGQISAHEYPGWRAELDRDEATATRLLSLLQPNRYATAPIGSVTAAAFSAVPGQPDQRAGDAFAAATFPEIAAQQARQAALAAGAPAAVPTRIGL